MLRSEVGNAFELFAFILCLSLVETSSFSRPVDLSAPIDDIGRSSSKGYLEIWNEIKGVGLQFGTGSYLSLRYEFTSDPSMSGSLGPGFFIPMFEARNTLLREDTMRVYLPCGKGLYLWRDPASPNTFTTPNQEWTGTLDRANGDFAVARDDGWKILYNKGHLSSITTDENHVFTWLYEGDLCVGINEDDRSAISVQYNSAGLLKAINFGGKTYEQNYAERPIIESLAGQTVIKRLDQSLSSFKYPDGKADTYSFALTPDRTPTLTFTDKDKKQSLFSWDASTDHIVSEAGAGGNWTYSVGELTQKFGQPPISRTSSDGKEESKTVDVVTGVTTITSSALGTFVEKVFKTPGPLYEKPREITRTIGNQTVTHNKFSYNELGQLIRTTDLKGFTTNFSYDASGKIIKRIVDIPSDPALLSQLKKSETAQLSTISQTDDPKEKSSLLEKLAFFYIHDMGRPDKALALLPQITEPKHIFNVLLHSIDGDVSLTGHQKADKFRELLKRFPGKSKLLDILIAARDKETQ